MSDITWKKDETVAIVTMGRGENLHNLEFATRLNEVIDEVVADTEVYSMVLVSDHPKSWSLGVDLEWIGTALNDHKFDDIKNFMYGMNDVFRKLFTIPIPTIAAISGHAFGNGAILACACDFRFMRSDRGYFCFPEVDRSIPFLHGMTAFSKTAMPFYKFNELKLTGKRAGAEELEKDHVIVKACANPEELLADSVAYAKTFVKKRGIFAEHKQRMYQYIVDIMETEDPKYIEPLNLIIME